MDIKIFSDLFEIGFKPIPIHWNTKTNDADHYPAHKTDIQSKDGKPDMNDIVRWFKEINDCNGLALKLYPPFFMFDFDIKNDTRKNIYHEWFNIVTNTNEDVLKKVCIEKTRSGGYHVYSKFIGVDNKKMLAMSDEGKEVISVYTGGLLSFCDPTPGYELIHNDFNDIDFLTQDEFDLLCAVAAHFNNYQGEALTNDKKIIEYPKEYESYALQFDGLCTDGIFEQLLNNIDLFEVKGKRLNRKATYIPYLRKGSVATYSAKAYFHSKHLLIFSGSYIDFPNFHNKINEADTSWILTPTRIIYYSNKRDWQKTIKDIKAICSENELQIIESAPVTKQTLTDRINFPYDIFPDIIQQFIKAQVIQHEYLAGGILAAISTTIGNSCVLEAMPGYIIKPIVYMAIVSPPGGGKTPALTKAFKPLEDYDNNLYADYEAAMKDFNERMAMYEKDKTKTDKPAKPLFPQTLIKDSTIEMVVKVLSFNKGGCCLLADELIGFLNRMNQYKAGDEVQKWLSMWSGDPILLQRITREENKVSEPFCSIVGGIQPGVLESLGKEENEHNGFYHRFLFIYPELQKKRDWVKFSVPGNITIAFYQLFLDLLKYRNSDKTYYFLTDEASLLYKEWFEYKNKKYDMAQSDTVRGIIAKYQDYCLRFALIIQVVEDAGNRGRLIYSTSMERAIRLTEYFLGNMQKAIKILNPDTPVDRLQGQWEKLYNSLDVSFTAKTLVATAATFLIKEGSAKSFLHRQTGKLFAKTDKNSYEKMF